MIGKSRIIFRRFMRNRTAVAGLFIFGAVPLLPVRRVPDTWDKDTIDPSTSEWDRRDHFTGTSQAGIDLMALIVEGTRISIFIGLIVGGVSVLISAVYGCSMAFFGGKVDAVMLFILEALIMMPAILVVAVATSGAAD